MIGGGDTRGETDDGVDTEGEEECEEERAGGGSIPRVREEDEVGTEVSGLSTLADKAGFLDLAPILGSKLSGRLDLGP